MLLWLRATSTSISWPRFNLAAGYPLDGGTDAARLILLVENETPTYVLPKTCAARVGQMVALGLRVLTEFFNSSAARASEACGPPSSGWFSAASGAQKATCEIGLTHALHGRAV